MTIAENPASALPRLRRYTRSEYYKMGRLGFFKNQRVELIDGEIIWMSPQNNPHALSVAIVTQWLITSLGSAYTVRCQLPLVGSERTEPEPDFAVIPGPPESQREHPRTALLVIEVSDTTLRHDRRKASLYASLQVQEYWIMNLAKRRLEVHRQPIQDDDAKFGFKYREVSVLELSDQVAPLQLPIASVAVSKLFPAVVG